ncbi:DegT/DnrJ/EryC1/StrS aminotransferase [Paludibacter propionicigenes WB4]|uniref:GDP-perosamine synthase n=1 Tax=Paludibacter propionicigenes (strain DSM 17365 / JCM 13257 / WB4) TaxID=694427 RepID=E4T304_PALPW|nr:aminotransferase class I/II-fold pyridoxal phosphate-dependent enzyme [Paludibacter propionicigenes]ADQ79098.1 DegT/DnrJ/EryC1/StrS aminotransferase [Paludibacter propionicigenes WB4]
MNKKIWLSLAHMGGREQEYIKEAFDTNWVVPLGPNVNAFEESLINYIGEDKKVVALSAGTAAIHLALLQLGVGLGDEVICQSFTFSASANPITYLGAKPVFVDSEADTWNMDPVFLEEAILDRVKQTGNKPKAIIPVHLYGMPAKMNEIMKISVRYEIPVLEDAAEALGSEYNGHKCGTFGEFACLSFNGNKIITTSGGGALVCSTEQEAHKTVFYATQARDNAPHYQHSEIGYNYRLSNICAGIGRGQMLVLQDHVDKRREINSFYRNELSSIDGISFQTEPTDLFHSNYWLTSILIDPNKTGGKTADELRLALDAANIESRPLWKPMHLQPVFANCPSYVNGTSEKLFNMGLCIPSSSILSEEDLKRVVDVIKSFFN